MGSDGALWAREFAGVAFEFLQALQAYLGVTEGYESISEVWMEAKRHSTAHLLLGHQAILHQDELGETFIQRCGLGPPRGNYRLRGSRANNTRHLTTFRSARRVSGWSSKIAPAHQCPK
jgi:hypothetical protein